MSTEATAAPPGAADLRVTFADQAAAGRWLSFLDAVGDLAGWRRAADPFPDPYAVTLTFDHPNTAARWRAVLWWAARRRPRGSGVVAVGPCPLDALGPPPTQATETRGGSALVVLRVPARSADNWLAGYPGGTITGPYADEADLVRRLGAELGLLPAACPPSCPP